MAQQMLACVGYIIAAIQTLSHFKLHKPTSASKCAEATGIRELKGVTEARKQNPTFICTLYFKFGK